MTGKNAGKCIGNQEQKVNDCARCSKAFPGRRPEGPHAQPCSRKIGLIFLERAFEPKIASAFPGGSGLSTIPEKFRGRGLSASNLFLED
ncbi:MAG: hypothetical protein ACT4N2_14695 [Hyphomicrobium sp.]